MNIKTFFFALTLICAASPAHAQVATDSGAFFVRLGKDTIAVERYVRTPHTLKAEAVLRTPETRLYKLNLTFREDGRVSWYEVQNNPAPGVASTTPVLRTVITYGTDSARIQGWVAAVPHQGKAIAATPDMIPLQMPFYSTYETALRRARKANTDTTTINMLSAAGPFPYMVTFGRADSVTLSSPISGTMTGRFGTDGTLRSLDGEQTTFKVNVTRAKWADTDAYLKRFAAQDSAGKPFGPLSPRALASGVLQGDIMVEYGQPSRRGRKIFGGIVPWGEVWRTGANEATTIRFVDTVQINGATIPAGKYSLWTIPDTAGWQLIINRQTGQWGTRYDEAQDLVRIPVETQTLSTPVETFKIEFAPAVNDETVMTMMWDRTKVIVPIRRKK